MREMQSRVNFKVTQSNPRQKTKTYKHPQSQKNLIQERENQTQPHFQQE